MPLKEGPHIHADYEVLVMADSRSFVLYFCSMCHERLIVFSSIFHKDPSASAPDPHPSPC